MRRHVGKPCPWLSTYTRASEAPKRGAPARGSAAPRTAATAASSARRTVPLGSGRGARPPRHVRVRTFISGNTVSTLCYLYKKTNFSGGTEQKATVGQKPVKSHDLSRSGYREGKRVRPARGAAPRPHPTAEAGGVLRNLGFGKNMASRQVNGFA